MTTDFSALRVAIDLLHAPSRVRIARSRPLPGGVVFLLRVAAGDLDAERLAVDASERSRDVVHEAALFFIEQVMFDAESDSYRVLGADRLASPAELRLNMALLLRSYHPDVDRDGGRALSAAKVTQAWDSLKTAERRARYDDLHPPIEFAAPVRTKSSGAKTVSKRKINRRIALEKRSPGRRQAAYDTNEKPPSLLRAILILLGLRRRRMWRRP